MLSGISMCSRVHYFKNPITNSKKNQKKKLFFSENPLLSINAFNWVYDRRKRKKEEMAKVALSGRMDSGLLGVLLEQAVTPVLCVPAAPTIMSVFEQQHPTTEAVRDIMEELARLANIDMAVAAADYESEGGMPPLPVEAYSGADGMQILADQAEQMRANEEKMVPFKKRSFKQSIGEVLDDDEGAGAVDAGSQGKRIAGDGISVEQIKEFYGAILSCDVANRYHFTECIKMHANKFAVSVTSLRNILTFKNRRQDSSPFWNEALWELYKKSCRCVTCREELRASSKVLCTHFGRGRPSGMQKHKELTATRHRKSSAEMQKKKESNNGLQRAYIVQISVTHVWAVLGCVESQHKLLDKNADGLHDKVDT